MGLVGILLVFVGEMNVKTTTGEENASRGEEESVLSTTEHLFLFLDSFCFFKKKHIL